ncbi:hypothetical protein F5890DRAFT_1383520, partial [Lentinula detonsa]
LRDSRYVQADEKVSIFLRLMIFGMGNREAQERFQRSADTISKSFHSVLDITSGSFYIKYVKLPSGVEVSPIISNDPRFQPFSEAQATIDGS